MNFEIKCKKLNDEAVIPTKGSKYSAGWDLSSIGEYEIAPGGCVKVDTGLSFELPANTFGAIFPRSGLATKRGLRLANCVGVCDEDYRGSYIIPLYNDSNEIQYIHKGDRVAQLIILPYVADSIIQVDELSDTERSDGGFGHTGV
jgi:dUTP pyrophosphatase